MSARRGDEMEVGIDTTIGNYASPTLSILTTFASEQYESIRQALKYYLKGNNFIGNRLGKQEKSIPLTTYFHVDDTDREALKAAHEAGTETQIVVVIGDGGLSTSGTNTDKFPMVVQEYKEDHPEDGVVKVDLKLVLGDIVNNAPSLSQTVA